MVLVLDGGWFKKWSNQTSSVVIWIIVEVEIPEFPVVLVPVGGVFAVFLLVGISKRSRGTKRG
jgi:hypothetical protein